MTPETLLRELDTLSHDRRMRRMEEVGKQAARDPEAAATLAALEQGDFYQRLLSLQACYGSRDGERVLRALAGVSRALRRRGVRLLALCGRDEQVRHSP